MHDGAYLKHIAIMALVKPFHLVCKLLRVQILVLYDMREWTTQWKRFRLFKLLYTTDNTLLLNFNLPPVCLCLCSHFNSTFKIK